ncbi:MAG: hypothetical protein ACFB2W_07905 [Leptolyngbyaceae cyanobacterium]
MVRRLIQRFLHWLRRLLNPTHGAKQGARSLPPSQQLPPPIANRPAAAPPDLSRRPPTQQQLAETPHKSRPETPRAPLNPASVRVNNPSRFRVLLSDYDYSPSSAIQNLSHQLSHPETATPQAPASQQPQLSFLTKDSVIQKDISGAAPANKQPQKVTEPLQADSSGTSTTERRSSKPTVVENATQLSKSPAEQVSDKSSLTAIREPQSSPKQPVQTPGVITKQGVIKLLFKLKKNNHHGYIAPNDGSKDIIFHQKYVGSEVFAKLERGMAVEVAARVIEGKAYADHIRIL